MRAVERQEGTRQSLTDATSASLMRIALAFGLLNACVPLLVAIVGREPPLTVALGIAWVLAWWIAILRVQTLRSILVHPTARWLLAVLCAAATATTIHLSGGLESPIANGANWIGWAATVVVSWRTALGMSGVLSAGTTFAFLLDRGSVSALLQPDDRYVVVTGMFNPPIIVLVALALAGVFHSVIASAPGTLWHLRRGAPASSPGLTAVLRAEPRPALAAPDPVMADSAQGPPAEERLAADSRPVSVVLTREERQVIDLLADGLVPKEIARLLQRSPDTIYNRIKAAKEKVNANTIEHLIALAWRPNA